MFRALLRAAAFFGPTPGMRTWASTLSGTCDFSSSSIGSEPDSTLDFAHIGQIAVEAGAIASR